MKDFPRDMELNIFSFFNRKDLRNTSIISKHWHKLTLMTLLIKAKSQLSLDELRKFDGEKLVATAWENKQLGLIIVAHEEFSSKITSDGLLTIMGNDFETAQIIINNNKLFKKFNKEQLISLIKMHGNLHESIIKKCKENNFDSKDIAELSDIKDDMDYSPYFEGAINSSKGGLIF